MLKKIWNQTLIRYCVVGGLSYFFELIILFILYELFGIQRIVATGIAFWFGLIIAFILQKIFAFKDYSREKKSIAKQSVFYALLVVWNYIFTLIIVSIMPENYLFYSRTLALIITTIWNFLVYKYLIFNNKNFQK